MQKSNWREEIKNSEQLDELKVGALLGLGSAAGGALSGAGRFAGGVASGLGSAIGGIASGVGSAVGGALSNKGNKNNKTKDKKNMHKYITDAIERESLRRRNFKTYEK